ncbi:hypothetical protein Nocox_13885 [Nonomuraea coxensis DSM 45129]|uniref:Transposase IS701-like DDE domain-containing protein n=1 Tax=Nonomuraea coxensis DSM 45129 TaxID=1122611 RepID=A0ABX8U196_9ACTN|nr:transposase [Nonomuraea coxensis]QYC40393.1 hypothetical protein Nocox_13885 [Nonomuraea coxensis DSM 45129]
MSLLNDAACVESSRVLSRFRKDVYACLRAQADALFELTDALLCEPGPVHSPVDLSLSPEYRRGHGALYGGLNHGRIDVEQLREVLAGLPLPRWPDGRIVLAVCVSPWLRSDAACSAERLFCHVYGRAKSASQFIPGWPYSLLTPARVRRGFRNLRPALAQPAGAPKPSRPGPRRPPGIPNRRPAPRYDVGKTVKRGRTLAALQQSGR